MNSGIRYLIFFVLIVGLSYVAWAYMIKPANAHLTQERAKMEALQAKLNELERATATAQDLNVQLQKIEEAIAAFESKLPPSSEIHTVLENVTLIAQRQGLTPKAIRTLKNRQNRGYIEQPLSMELHGNFNSYYAFLLELEKLDRITKIRELTLKKSKQEGQTEATFVMSIFFQSAA
ncbi:MAG TPA: type 4a pilus biogenesis protein PilO [Anaerohalosphaeraceae bacterium]|nr:type 4a pilus biogenesis protein PilO [Phycisphaerae bacterium]HOK94635.1 type 4a pilus biogenesis protein PilO [Anaerohalosphaeraceae bacterium]HOL30892.1 type 4a pilus biogenesis protein PilO [Anaerohalosphaeraceae bacterium]HOM76042.1 type 4a pilus biogenesis protein PilO [Anaerohalosphaeraceae bacterium]HPC64208.1 type 4a pilus biogenesis protein PilO [Anaerohalosphaeraceae bacterium]